MKRINVPLPEDLYRELTLTKRLYPTSITKLVSAAISYALSHKREVWGFTKKLEE